MLKTISRLLLLATLLCGLEANAQKNLFSTAPLTDARGNPIPVVKYQRLNGSPYLFDDWVPGEVVTADGKYFNGMLLKFNIESNLLTFVYNPKDEPLRFPDPIHTFNLFADRKISFANNFPNTDGFSASTYYEVLSPGKTMLLKHHRQNIRDTRSDDLSLTSGTYINFYNYYIFRNGQMKRIKLNKESVTAALNDKATQVNSFLALNPIDFKSDADLAKLFEYYNGL